MHNQKTQWFLLLLFFFAFSLAEYVFLGLPPGNGKLYLMGLKLFSKAGWFVRLLLAVLYPLGFAMQPARLAEAHKEDKTAKISSGRIKALQVLLYLLGSALLVSLHYNPFFRLAYPLSVILVGIGGYYTGNLLKRKPVEKNAIQADRKKKPTPYSFHFKGKDQSGAGGKWVNIVNPFRGTLVIGGAGSGKSHSIAEPILHQAAQKEYSGIVYDFKFPTLSDFAYSQYTSTASEPHQVEITPLSFYVVNFEDLTRTHRVNPLKPEYIPAAAFASEYALSIVNNLMPETIAKPDFWARSAQSLLTATIWFLKKKYPRFCTLPHVIQMIVYRDYNVLLRLLAEDYECASMIRSILTAAEMKAANQTAGMVSTLQLGLGRINTPEICYVLSGDEFSLDINDPDDPKVLCLGSSPTLAETFAPLISCTITVALKLMNQQGKRHSLVLLDEAPTLYIPHLDQLPATARSNKVATVYMAQDFSQMKKQYGQNEAEVLISNLNNQFFGRVANLNTAEYVSRLFGKEERVIRSESSSNNTPRGVLFNPKAGTGSQGNSVSHSLVERTVVYPQQLLNLEVGHFMGTTVETDNTSFSMQFQSPDYPRNRIEPFRILEKEEVAATYAQIIAEAESILATAPPAPPVEKEPVYRVG